MFEVSDFKQLVKMFYAGCGTFFVLNLTTKRKFTLQFKRSQQAAKNGLFYSDIHVCFNDGLLFHLGRYNFKYQLMQLSDETYGYSYERLCLFIRSFKFVRDRIINGSGFPEPHYRVFYDGSCCRCGKQLENPDSIKIGFGPDCDVLLEIEAKTLQLQLPM